MPTMLADLALAHLTLPDLITAHRQATRAVTCAANNPVELANALEALARTEAALQDWEQAVQHFSQAIALNQQIGDRHLAARAQRHFAEALLRQDERQKAVELLEAALATFQELDLAHEIAETRRLLEASKI